MSVYLALSCSRMAFKEVVLIVTFLIVCTAIQQKYSLPSINVNPRE